MHIFNTNVLLEVLNNSIHNNMDFVALSEWLN